MHQIRLRGIGRCMWAGREGRGAHLRAHSALRSAGRPSGEASMSAISPWLSCQCFPPSAWHQRHTCAAKGGQRGTWRGGKREQRLNIRKPRAMASLRS